ncbi:YbaB/EbfC family nucleoid-associated protein [Actinophytocola glycyrrhizae]|uniref:YbaB/EbfC family nucleoid-associated protein n=1 Tax=Actinophytocola glycyrrhizae TaxID=2044873 RepID=A0ABV9RUK9_9PSEU
MSEHDDRRAQLEARNAAMRENVAALMSDLRRRTAGLAEAQAKANEVTGKATSEDGLVRAEVNPAGVLTNLEFSWAAFDRYTPESLAKAVLQTSQAAARSARQQVEGALAPFAEETPDLSNLFEGAPSFADLLRPPAPGEEGQDGTRPSRSRRDEDDDDNGSIYGRD